MDKNSFTPIASTLRLSRANPVRERLGWIAGYLFVPWVAAGSYLRAARLFHPEGVCYEARITPITFNPDFAIAAERLRGAALVRLSAALWRRHEGFDVLGIAIRFVRDTKNPETPEAGDQDLLLATIRSPWLLFAAPFTTRARNFFENVYYGVAPFDVEGNGRVKIRLVPEAMQSSNAGRYQLLDAAVAAGLARFRLEMRRTWLSGKIPVWKSVAEVKLNHPIEISPRRLRFSPFRSGRGIEPRGFIHALRRATYPASQKSRELAARRKENVNRYIFRRPSSRL